MDLTAYVLKKATEAKEGARAQKRKRVYQKP